MNPVAETTLIPLTADGAADHGRALVATVAHRSPYSVRYNVRTVDGRLVGQATCDTRHAPRWVGCYLADDPNPLGQFLPFLEPVGHQWRVFGSLNDVLANVRRVIDLRVW